MRTIFLLPCTPPSSPSTHHPPPSVPQVAGRDRAVVPVRSRRHRRGLGADAARPTAVWGQYRRYIVRPGPDHHLERAGQYNNDGAHGGGRRQYDRTACTARQYFTMPGAHARLFQAAAVGGGRGQAEGLGLAGVCMEGTYPATCMGGAYHLQCRIAFLGSGTAVAGHVGSAKSHSPPSPFFRPSHGTCTA